MDHIYRSFYTKNSAITNYMISMIQPAASDTILEPCGGDGMFIDALLEFRNDLRIDTCDLNIEAVDILEQKYAEHAGITVRQADTLTDGLFDSYALSGYYDKIVGNPPYGGWQAYERRELLKKKYPGFHVKETYALFLLRCISMLKDTGVLSFIIPDTFLYLHYHTALRAYLLTHTRIREILIFPSKLFPGVSFMYSQLSIITVEKTAAPARALQNTFRVVKGLKEDEDLQKIRLCRDISDLETIHLKQEDVWNHDHHSFLLGSGCCMDLIADASVTLGELADCVTGLYTGNNPNYLAVLHSSVKNSKNYPVIPRSEVDFECRSPEGIDGACQYIPIVKGPSKTKYMRGGDSWLIRWTREDIAHYHRDKKARFQNSFYYFRTGIALPMVKGSRINATLMEGRVFDQSIVGVFPREEKYLYFLLGFLNSDVAEQLIHLINPTANNSSNYLKKLPVTIPAEAELEAITLLVKSLLAADISDSGQKQKELNAYFHQLFGMEE